MVRRAHVELGAELVAFKYASEKGDFEASWGEYAVECYLVDEPGPRFDGCRYAALGGVGLSTTGATEALCFGGGHVVAREFRSAEMEWQEHALWAQTAHEEHTQPPKPMPFGQD